MDFSIAIHMLCVHCVLFATLQKILILLSFVLSCLQLCTENNGHRTANVARRLPNIVNIVSLTDGREGERVMEIKGKQIQMIFFSAFALRPINGNR